MGIALAIGFIGMIISVVIASSKNRNVAGWAALGFLFPLIGILIVASLEALPDPNTTISPRSA